MNKLARAVHPLVLASAVAAGCGANGGTQSASVPVPARSPSDPEVIIGERVSIDSKVLGERRGLLVYRPPDCATAGTCPVAYLLDGDAHFHHVTGLIQFLSMQERMPRVILVGLSNVDRARDFTPTRDEQLATSGGADRFLEFLESELVPSIERHYSAARYRILIGHSLGGLFAVHALNQKPGLFDAYVSISPSLGWGSRVMQRQTEALLIANPTLDRVLYLTVGRELAEMVDSTRAYADLLGVRAPSTLRWRFEELPGEDHGSIVHRGIYRGFELVFAGWTAPVELDTIAALERHHRGLAARFGIEVKVPERSLNSLGYRMLGAGRVDDAIAAFRRGVELYPESANIHDSLGEAFERKGDRDAAIESYELAVRHAARNRDPMLESYLGHLGRLRSAPKPSPKAAPAAAQPAWTPAR
ncbi:MAG TPA: alpha/beta hydrolase-fold protein [Kofleriaceae bacterium]|nr:alpha/beta hydrolase-fold protein [Kofleriaceae bacterium]